MPSASTAASSRALTLSTASDAKIRAGKPLREGSKAVVHIYGKDYEVGLRPSFYFGGVESPMFRPKPAIFLDNAVVARIAENHFLTLEVPAGKHTFKTDRNELELELREGQEICLRLTTKGILGTKGHLEVASLDEGEEECTRLSR